MHNLSKGKDNPLYFFFNNCNTRCHTYDTPMSGTYFKPQCGFLDMIAIAWHCDAAYTA